LIVNMKKVLMLGIQEDQEKLLAELQQVGVLHIEPVAQVKKNLPGLETTLNEVREAISILKEYTEGKPEKPCDLSGKQLVQSVRRLKNQVTELENCREDLAQQLKALADWGDFSGQLLEELAAHDVRLRFWQCQSRDIDQFCDMSVVWQKRRGKLVRLVTVYYQDDTTPTTAEEIKIDQGPREIRQTLQDTDQKLQESKNQLQALSGGSDLLRKHESELIDQMSFGCAKMDMLEQDQVFGIQGWVPQDRITAVEDLAQKLPVALEIKDPQEDEQPPTLIRNPRWIQSILDVVRLYATPGYEEWDPSASVYFAFAVFFSMIVGDAGYGCLLLLLMLGLRKKLMKSEIGARVFRLMITLSIGCIIFGLVTCTWFALKIDTIAKGSPFDFLRYLLKFQLFDATKTELMLNVSIYVGATHLCIARMIKAIRLMGSSLWLAEIGWMITIWSAIAYILWKVPIGIYGICAGLALVFFFSDNSRNVFKRAAGGLVGLLGFSQNMADVLSYLRLFALGLATTVMGGIFNQLGMDIHEAVPGIIGYVLMVAVIFMGHSVNLLLALMGGFIHGLRLNFLEFYRYCFEGTGQDYTPFLKTGA